MSSLSIAPTDSLKRPFRPEDQGPVQKKRRVSSDTEIIDTLVDTICKFGEYFLGEDCPIWCCEPAKKELTCVLGLNRKVDVLYTKLVVLQKTLTGSPEEIEARANTDRDIRQEVEFKDSETIKKLANVVCNFADVASSDGFSTSCRFVIRTLKESSKLNEEIDAVREQHFEVYMTTSEDYSNYAQT